MLSALALTSFGSFANEEAAAPVAPVTEQAVVATEQTDSAPVATATEEQPAPAAAPAEATTKEQADKVDVLPWWEMVAFCVVVVAVIGLGIWKASDGNEAEKSEDEKAEKGAADYFLAGRGLTWWLVGFSLLAANISTEQFVGMSGQAADWLGLAIAGYEWLAAIVLVVVVAIFVAMMEINSISQGGPKV